MGAESFLFAYFHLSILTVTPRHTSKAAIEGNHVRDDVTVPSKFTIILNAFIEAVRAQERAVMPRGHEYHENN